MSRQTKTKDETGTAVGNQAAQNDLQNLAEGVEQQNPAEDLEQIKQDLDNTKKDLSNTREELARTREQLAASKKGSADLQRKLTDSRRQLSNFQKQVAKSQEQAVESQGRKKKATTAQQEREYIARGQVLDEGRPLAGIEVELRNPLTGEHLGKVITGKDGRYESPIPVKHYIAVAFGQPHADDAEEISTKFARKGE
jgi:hypothetical protein